MENLEDKVKGEPKIYDLCFFLKYYYFPIIHKMEGIEISDRFLKDVNMLIRLFKISYYDPINKRYTFKEKFDNGELNLPELIVPVYERIIKHLTSYN